VGDNLTIAIQLAVSKDRSQEHYTSRLTCAGAVLD